jgi:myosin heavy subunit
VKIGHPRSIAFGIINLYVLYLPVCSLHTILSVCLHTILTDLRPILTLNSNLSFAASRDVDGGSRVTVPADSRRVATLLEMPLEGGGAGLERALCFRSSTVNGETMLIPLTPDRAVDQRDALAKYVYGKLFDRIVELVNYTLFRGRPGTSIGVLDIFGFEVFALNSFEQLTINYCNER